MKEQPTVEILTQAVKARRHHRLAWNHAASAENICSVLGAQVKHVSMEVREAEGRYVIDLLVEFELWCITEGKSKLVRTTTFHRAALQDVQELLDDAAEVRADLVRDPRVVGARVEEGELTVKLEAEVGIEVIQPVRLRVASYEQVEEARAKVSAMPPGPNPVSGPRRKTAISHFSLL